MSCIRFSTSTAQFISFVVAVPPAISCPGMLAHLAPGILDSNGKGSDLVTGTDDVRSIEGVIQAYLDGLYESDAAKIANAFHPTSALTSVTGDGELVITPRDLWLENVRTG